jgi:hypothetical protein
MTANAITFDDIAAGAKLVSETRDRLGDLARAYDKALAAVRDEHTPGVKTVIEELRGQYDALLDLVRAAPDLFVRPKSIELSGLKLGFRRNKGRVEFADPAKLERRLRALQGLKVISKDTVEGIVTVKVKVSKAALAKLDGNILKRLGVDVVAGQDGPFAQPVDGEIDRLVKLLFAQDDEDDQ